MSIKANYFKIGLFVNVAVILLIGAIIFWSANSLRKDKYIVETYIDESVKGLSRGSIVYYQGIQIGSVELIATAPALYDFDSGTAYDHYIVIRIALTRERIASREDTSQYFKDIVKEGLCFQMKSSPLTGVGYLEGSIYNDRKNPPDWTAWEPKHTYIPSVPSLMDTLSDSAETILTKLAKLDIQSMIDNINILLTDLDKGVKDLQLGTVRASLDKVVTNADDAITQLKSMIRSTDTAKSPVTVEDIMIGLNSSVESLKQVIEEVDVKGISDQGKGLLTELRQTNQDVRSLIRSTDQTKPLSNLEDTLADLNETIRQINLMVKQQYPNINLAIQNLVETSQNIKEGTADIKNQPSKLIFSPPPAKSETVK